MANCRNGPASAARGLLLAALLLGMAQLLPGAAARQTCYNAEYDVTSDTNFRWDFTTYTNGATAPGKKAAESGLTFNRYCFKLSRNQDCEQGGSKDTCCNPSMAAFRLANIRMRIDPQCISSAWSKNVIWSHANGTLANKLVTSSVLKQSSTQPAAFKLVLKEAAQAALQQDGSVDLCVNLPVGDGMCSSLALTCGGPSYKCGVTMMTSRVRAAGSLTGSMPCCITGGVDANAAVAVCPDGQGGANGACAACPAGTYGKGLTSAQPCVQCSATSYSDQPGASACTECPGGVQANAQRTGCTSGNNPAGPCPDGYGGVAGVCTQCAAGTYGASLTEADPCVACPAGQWSAAGAASCDLCADGYGGVAGVCTQCAAGKYGSGLTPSQPCASCVGNSTSAAGAAACTPCAAGEIPNGGKTACFLPQVDFNCTGFVINTSPLISGNAMNLDVNFKNIGNTGARPGNIAVWADKATPATCGDTSYNLNPSFPITIGAGSTGSIRVTLPGTAITTGTHTLRAMIDSACVTGDVDTTNNQCELTYVVP